MTADPDGVIRDPGSARFGERRLSPGEWQEAVAATEGPQLVVAGPGAGKTEFLVRRIAHLIDNRDVPGSAILELAVEPREGGSAVLLEAHFHPAGAPGLLYWYALWPVHRRIFAGLPRAIAHRAEAARG